MYFESKIYKLLNEQDDDKYSHIGYGKYKEKGKEDDENAPVFTKNDAGKYVPSKEGGEEKTDDEPKKVAKIDANPFDKADDQADDMKSDDAQAEKDKEDIKDALDGALEGMYDALNRGMDYGDDRDVDRMIDDDIQSALDAGATDDDLKAFAQKLDSDARQMFQDSLDNLAYNLDVTAAGSKLDLRPSDPDYKSPGELDKLGSDNPYDKGDEYDADYDDSGLYNDLSSLSDDDLDNGISTAVKGIRPEMREKAFDMIIQGFDDDFDVDEMYKNLKNGKIPKPEEDPFGAIQHTILMQGIEDGTIDYGTKGMELANYLETREEDLYDQMMDPDQYDEVKELKENFQKRAGII